MIGKAKLMIVNLYHFPDGKRAIVFNKNKKKHLLVDDDWYFDFTRIIPKPTKIILKRMKIAYTTWLKLIEKS